MQPLCCGFVQGCPTSSERMPPTIRGGTHDEYLLFLRLPASVKPHDPHRRCDHALVQSLGELLRHLNVTNAHFLVLRGRRSPQRFFSDCCLLVQLPSESTRFWRGCSSAGSLILVRGGSDLRVAGWVVALLPCAGQIPPRWVGPLA